MNESVIIIIVLVIASPSRWTMLSPFAGLIGAMFIVCMIGGFNY